MILNTNHLTFKDDYTNIFNNLSNKYTNITNQIDILMNQLK